MGTNQFNTFRKKLNQIKNYSCFYIYKLVMYLPCISVQEDNLYKNYDNLIDQSSFTSDLDINETQRVSNKIKNSKLNFNDNHTPLVCSTKLSFDFLNLSEETESLRSEGVVCENYNKQNINIDEITKKYKKTVNIENNYFK